MSSVQSFPKAWWSSCSGVGSYNPVYGRCTCPIGRSGPNCEVNSLPACRLRRNSSVTTCMVRRPLSCDCMQQCVSNGAFAAQLYPICFTRDDAHHALSDLPNALGRRDHQHPAIHFSRWSNRQFVSAHEALKHEFRPWLRHVPHRLCPRRCSERGACLADANDLTYCQCDSWYRGRSCETFTGPTCYNNCSAGRGTCVEGFCVCRAPHFGPACAYTASNHRDGRGGDGGSSHFGHIANFRIHVYVVMTFTYLDEPCTCKTCACGCNAETRTHACAHSQVRLRSDRDESRGIWL